MTTENTMARRLAVGILWLLTDRAIPSFPGSTRSSPSLWVIVERASGIPLVEGDQGYFPMRVPWHVWSKIVVPILTVTKPTDDPRTLVVGSGAVAEGDLTASPCHDLGVEIRTTLRSSLRLSGNTYLLALGDYTILLAKIEQAVGLLLEDQGYLPYGRITGRAA